MVDYKTGRPDGCYNSDYVSMQLESTLEPDSAATISITQQMETAVAYLKSLQDTRRTLTAQIAA